MHFPVGFYSSSEGGTPLHILYFWPKGKWMNYILVDTNSKNFYPLTYTRSVSDLRVGIYTIHEKWEKLIGKKIYRQTESFLQDLYPFQTGDDNIFINAKFIPTPDLADQIRGLVLNQKLIDGADWIACRIAKKDLEITSNMSAIPADTGDQVENWWDMLKINGAQIVADLQNFHPYPSDGLSDTNLVIGKRSKLYIHPTAKVDGAIFNTSGGPIFIDEHVTVQEGSMIRGPFAALKGSIVKMGAKIYEGTTLGPSCLVGGEVKNAILLHSSNKAHEGYLGNSYLGEGVNLGAGTSCSNLKNNASSIKVWNYIERSFTDTGQSKLGCVIGDHSKIAINSSINTGSTIGVSCNVFGKGFPNKWIPNFSWGSNNQVKFEIESAIQSYQKWCALNGKAPSKKTEATLRYLAKRRE